MTISAFCSVAGAPGCTTLACLVGAVWPLGEPVLVAECDPNGGALAARFQLDTRVGMTSFVLANRHAEAGMAPVVEPHLQHLPGGLEVLVGATGAEAARAVDGEVGGVAALFSAGRAVMVDCGRLLTGAPGQHVLLARADAVVIVVSDEPAAVAALGATVGRLRQLVGGKLGLAPVTSRAAVAREIADAVGVQVAAVVPRDPAAAAIVRGQPGRARRLTRSPLVTAASRLHGWIRQSAVVGDIRPLAAHPYSSTVVSAAGDNGEAPGSEEAVHVRRR